MNVSIPNDHDVLIAGAGPVGLFLACELGLAGCSVLVLEQASDASTPLKSAPFGLRGLSVPTVDSFERRGLLAPLRAQIRDRDVAAAAPWMKEERRPGGHFAGIDFFLDQIDQAQWPCRLPHSASPMAADLESIGAVLTARAQELGVTIRYGMSVSDVVATDDDVTVRANGDALQGRWLVGCDGGRSAVRKAAGFDFTGTDPEFTGYFAQVELADASILEPGHHDTATGTYIFDLPDMIRMVEFDGGAHHRGEPITRDHLQSVLRRISGTNVELTAIGQVTTWTDRAYLATEYRRERVLLAGDAAHIHSPLGGQGLNLGLGDAMNLGWKLAATIRGNAAAGLLDSYQRERRPIAEQILDWSRAQVALMRPSRSAQALRTIVRDLIGTREGATYFAEHVWGVSVRYDLGGDHPLVGRSAPNFELADGTRLNEHLRDGRALLLDFGGSDRLRTLAGRYRDQLTYVPCNAGNPFASTPSSFVPMVLLLGQAVGLLRRPMSPELYRHGSISQNMLTGPRATRPSMSALAESAQGAAGALSTQKLPILFSCNVGFRLLRSIGSFKSRSLTDAGSIGGGGNPTPWHCITYCRVACAIVRQSCGVIDAKLRLRRRASGAKVLRKWREGAAQVARRCCASAAQPPR